jgi:hypothetical protein
MELVLQGTVVPVEFYGCETVVYFGEERILRSSRTECSRNANKYAVVDITKQGMTCTG